MKLFSLAVAIIMMTSGGCSRYKTVTRHDGVSATFPNCTRAFKYTGNSLEVEALKIPIPQVGTTVEVMGVKWDTKALHTVGAAGETLHKRVFSMCEQKMIAFQTMSAEDFQKFFLQCAEEESKLAGLIVFVLMNNPEAALRYAEYHTKWLPTPIPETAGLTGPLQGMRGIRMPGLKGSTSSGKETREVLNVPMKDLAEFLQE